MGSLESSGSLGASSGASFGTSNDADARRLLDSLRRIVRALRLGSSAVERAQSLSGAQLFVLQVLRDAPSPSIADVARRTLTDPSSVSVVVRRLRERGLLTYTPSPDDARRVRIALTRKGEAVAAAAPGTVQANLIAAFATLPEATRRSLGRGMAQLVTAMGIDNEVHLFFEEDARANAPPARTTRRKAMS